jgi:hypothetical protein
MTDLGSLGESNGTPDLNTAIASLVSLITGARAEALAGRLTPFRLKTQIDARIFAVLDAIYDGAPASGSQTDTAGLAVVRDGKLDPLAAWRALPPEVQQQLGAAAIAAEIGDLGEVVAAELGVPEEARPFEIAGTEAGALMFQLVTVFVLGGEDTMLPPRPDLRPLGIRQCRVCGCTDELACIGPGGIGCEWVELDLCSACVPGCVA